jgi:hypothetical protein
VCGFTSGLRHPRFATLIQPDLLECHENRWCTHDLNRQSIWENVDRVNKIFNQIPSLSDAGLVPECIDIQLSENHCNLLELETCPFASPLCEFDLRDFALKRKALRRESPGLFSESVGIDFVGVVEIEQLALFCPQRRDHRRGAGTSLSVHLRFRGELLSNSCLQVGIAREYP